MAKKNAPSKKTDKKTPRKTRKTAKAARQTTAQLPKKPRNKSSAKPDKAPARKKNFHIVGIGASAGGLAAFKKFFTAMPGDSGMAFVLIQHLDPTHQSITAELLDKITNMRVVEAVDEMRVGPNHVYVIPPNKFLTISGMQLHLTDPVEQRFVRAPIDFFFRSLAEDQLDRAIGIIFTGAGSDGTLGVREIKAAGGLIMVQSPETAQHDSMPRSAISTGMVDYVLPIEQIPAALTSYIQHRSFDGPAVPSSEPERFPDHLNTIIGLLRTEAKFDFGCYKKGTLNRRVQRRMGLKHIVEMGDYVALLRKEKEEITALFEDLLIGVTNFFREPESWRALAKLVLKPLVQQHDPNTPIRVWVPGCATGEEAYTIAILLTEILQHANKACAINIFASDIDQDALTFARAGIYPETISADVSPERLQRFFVKGEHTWRINKDIRESVIFAEQNLIGDPPFSKLDLVSCRNLLIYLEPQVQKKILFLCHFALRQGGFLFLGNSETISQHPDLFEPVSHKCRIYRCIGSLRQDRLELSVRNGIAAQALAGTRVKSVDQRSRNVNLIAQQIIIQRYAPACAVVNRRGEVLYLYGPVDDYLQLPAGELGSDLIAMTRQGLRAKVRSAIHRVIQSDRPVVIEETRVKRGGSYYPVRLTVEPLRQPQEVEGLLLVTFGEAGVEQQRVRVVYVEPHVAPPAEKPETAEEYEMLVRHLETELNISREDLQSTIEELETSNEEFKASNEEVTSINEELQSANEELETSKEELQSMNEELHTVNNQLEAKIQELEIANNNLSNLLSSIDYAILFLDRSFRIKKFTQATAKLLSVLDQDIGRPFRDFVKNIADENLLADAEKVLRHLMPIEHEFQDLHNRWYARRIVPYRTENQRIDGTVITFIDITARKTAEAAARRFATVLRDSSDAIALLDLEGRITAWNKGAERLYGYTEPEAQQLNLNDLLPAGERHPDLPEFIKQIAHDEDLQSFETKRLSKTGRLLDVWLTLTRLLDAQGRTIAIATTERDVTERVKQERALRESEARKSAILRASLDAIITIDAAGSIIEWNPAAERIFGWKREEVLNKDMAELIIPPQLRKRHHAGMQHFLATGEGPILNRLLELTALRRDGREFPVELAITRIELEGPPLFKGFIRDITRRKQAEADREAAQKQLEIVADSMAIPVTRCSRDLKYLWVNSHCANWLGHSLQEMVGRPIVDILGQSAMDQLRPHIEQVLSGNKVHFEVQLNYRSKGPCWIDTVYTPTYDESNKVNGWVAVVIDINDRKHAEMALRESEERFRSMTDSAPMLVWMSGLDKLCNYFNESWLQFTGRTFEQELGNGWTEGVHPDDYDRCLQIYVNAFDRREPFEMEYRLRHHNGEYRWILDCGIQRVTPDGEFLGYIGSCFDIHDRKAAEAKLRYYAAIVESTDDAIVSRSTDGIVTTWNRGAEKLYGYTAEEMIGQPIMKLVPPERQNEVLAIRERLQRGENVARLETVRLGKDGSLHDVALTMSAIRDTEGTYIGASIVARDITERNRMVRALSESEERLRLAAETAGFGCYDLEPLKRRNSWTKELYRITGLPESTPPHEQSIVNLVHRDDYDHFARLMAEALDPAGTGWHDLDYRIRQPQGKIRWLHDVGRTYFEDNGEGRRVSRLVGTIQDITQRKEAELELQRLNESLEEEVAERTAKLIDSEKRMRAIMDHTPALIYLKDLERRYIFINKAYEETLQLESNKVAGKTVHDLYPAKMAGEMAVNEKQVIEHGAAMVFEECVEGPHGTRFFLSTQFLLHDEQGRASALCGICLDITERRQVQQQLLVKTAELERTVTTLEASQTRLRKLASELTLTEERQRRLFASMLHDDIAQNLIMTKIELELLLKLKISKKVKGKLEPLILRLSEISQNTRELIYHLSPPILHEFGLEAAIKWLLEQFKLNHQLNFVFDDDNLAQPLPQDLKVILYQSIREALTNVVKHAKSRDGRLVIRHDSKQLLLELSDNGCGFDTSQLLQLQSGKGFGLFNIRERLLSFNCQFELNSAPGQGTRIRIIAPVEQSNIAPKQ